YYSVYYDANPNFKRPYEMIPINSGRGGMIDPLSRIAPERFAGFNTYVNNSQTGIQNLNRLNAAWKGLTGEDIKFESGVAVTTYKVREYDDGVVSVGYDYNTKIVSASYAREILA
ncbi:hypothetical protein, partial [Fulvivirga imtechensis]|uniref:hypothetical protein n=1 Tax=Fulvivirga imtechensis TaxID=881893 RepID=UPI00058BE1B6